ncbi:agamous-like MADS-box protein AGL29 [Carex rostrata]
MGRKGKTSEGRKKVEMKKIESDDARQVSFSKRKKGVFAKACELSTMCGAEVAVLLYSPSGSPHSFGSPSVDKVFNKFVSGEQFEYSESSDANMVNAINELNEEYMQLTQRLEASNAKREALEERIKKTGGDDEAKELQWLNKIDELGRDELLQLLGSLYRVKCSVNERMRAISLAAGNSTGTGAGPSNSNSMPSPSDARAPPPNEMPPSPR